MRVLSPAKINLHLRVGPKRSDGFHPLVSWMVTVGLFDTLDFTLDTAGRVGLSCSDPTLATDDSNLVVRAARMIQAEAMRSCGGETSLPTVAGERGVRIKLQKVIPMGGGLGGGSSNAATTLTALNDLWKLNLSRERLSEMASAIGSDVPFFLNGPSGMCTGRGEIISRVGPPRARWVVLVLPEMSMPTAEVYRRFDQMPALPGWDEAVDASQWECLLAEDLLRVLRNDLEPPAFAISPELGRLRNEAEQLVSRPVRMSGSGSTLFTLFDTRECAEQAAFIIQRDLGMRTMTVPIAASEEVSG
jgi:4-diphosphocytidyl-2-C-methyl-D-erythritol kinase